MLDELINAIEKEIVIHELRIDFLRNTLNEVRNWNETSFNNYVLKLAQAIKPSHSSVRFSAKEREVSLELKKVLDTGRAFTTKQLFDAISDSNVINGLNYPNFRYMISQKFLKAGIVDRFEVSDKVENELKYWYAAPFLFNAPGQPKIELYKEIKKALKALNKEISDHDIMSSWD